MPNPAKPDVSSANGDDNVAEFYSESGLIPSAAFTVMPLVCFSLAALGGVVYSYLMNWISIFYAHALIAIGAAFALGRFVAWAVARWHVRSVPFSLLFAAATSAVAYYSAWAADIFARFGFDAVDGNPLLAWSPSVLGRYIVGFYQVGWRVDGKVVNGPTLALHWQVEAALFFGFPLYEIWKNRKSRSFCEGCRRWTELQRGVMRFFPGGEADLVERLARRDFTALAERAGIPESEDIFLRMNVYLCRGCRITRHLTIERVAVQTNENGSQKIEVATVVDRMEVDDDTLQRIYSFGGPNGEPVNGPVPVAKPAGPQIGPPPNFR